MSKFSYFTPVAILSVLTGQILSPTLTQASEKIDLAINLIGRGYSKATYSCEDGSLLTAQFNVRADLGPVVEMSSDGKDLMRLSRYLSPVDAEINQCLIGQDSQGNAATVCFRRPGEIESIDLGHFSGPRFRTSSHCLVKSVRKIRE